jgi:hypothetical protein
MGGLGTTLRVAGPQRRVDGPVAGVEELVTFANDHAAAASSMEMLSDSVNTLGLNTAVLLS